MRGTGWGVRGFGASDSVDCPASFMRNFEVGCRMAAKRSRMAQDALLLLVRGVCLVQKFICQAGVDISIRSVNEIPFVL